MGISVKNIVVRARLGEGERPKVEVRYG